MTLTPQEAFSIARDVVMTAAWAVIWVARREYKQFSERIAELEADNESLRTDMYESGGRVSKIDHRLENLRTVLSLKGIVDPSEGGDPPVLIRRRKS